MIKPDHSPHSSNSEPEMAANGKPVDRATGSITDKLLEIGRDEDKIRARALVDPPISPSRTRKGTVFAPISPRTDAKQAYSDDESRRARVTSQRSDATREVSPLTRNEEALENIDDTTRRLEALRRAFQEIQSALEREEAKHRRANTGDERIQRSSNASNERERERAEHRPELYYPKGGALLNPFSQLRFTGNRSKLHPMNFLRKFRGMARFENMPSNQLLYYFGNCMTERAAVWWESTSHEHIEEAYAAFVSKYWSKTHQAELSRELHTGRYASEELENMSEYVTERYQQNKFLDSPIDEEIFVELIVNHLPARIREKLHVRIDTTVDQLAEQLDKLEHRRNDDGEERDSRITTANRTVERESVASKRTEYYGQRPREGRTTAWNPFKRKSSPERGLLKAAPRAAPSNAASAREPTARTRETSKSTSRGRNRSASPPNARRQTRTDDKKPGQAEISKPGKETSKNDVKTKNVGSIDTGYDSEYSSERKTTKRGASKGKNRRDKDDQDDVTATLIRSVDAQIRNDKRYYVPAKLVKETGQWHVDIFCDTGATSSLVREDTLEKFQEALKKQNIDDSLRTIKIKQQDFGGAFTKTDAKTNRMVQLTIRFQQTNGLELTLRHKFNVIKRMNKPIVIGQDVLMKHYAYTRPKVNGEGGTLVFRLDPETKHVVSYDVDRNGEGTTKPATRPKKNRKSRRKGEAKRAEETEEQVDGTAEGKRITQPREDPICQSRAQRKRKRREKLSKKSTDKPRKIRYTTKVEKDDESTGHNTDKQDPRVRTLMDKHAELFDGRLGLIHGYIHRINVKNDKPKAAKSYPIPLKYQKEVSRQIDEMESLGVIAKRQTEYINPLVVVHKPNGELRLCLDARSVNCTTTKDYAQPPNIDEVLALIGKDKVYSKLDVSKAYCRVATENRF